MSVKVPPLSGILPVRCCRISNETRAGIPGRNPTLSPHIRVNRKGRDVIMTHTKFTADRSHERPGGA